MAIFTIEKINYVITGSSEKLINVRLADKHSNVKTNRNFTFVTDEGPDIEVNDKDSGYYLSASYRTHRLNKLFKSDEALYDDDELMDCKKDNLTLVYSLFDAKDVVFKSNIYRKIVRSTEDTESLHANIDNYVDVYSPRMVDDFIAFVQYHKFDTFGMTRDFGKEPYMQYTTLRDDRMDRLSNDSGKMIWNFKMENRDVDTFTYTPISDLRDNSFNVTGDENYDPTNKKYMASSYYSWLRSFGDLSSDRLSSLFEPRYNLSGIPRNFIANFNMTMEKSGEDLMYNDFNTGVIAGNFMYSKNPYNAEYSMVMKSSNPERIDRRELSGVREYVGLGQMGGKLFLKYYDDRNYIYDDSGVETGSDDPRKSLDFPYSTVDADKITKDRLSDRIDLTLQDVPMIENIHHSPERKYQNVEFFESTNRGLNVAKHKSNLYSVTIKGLALEKKFSDEKLNIVRQDIKNMVRKICERLAPAHTQLFNVNISKSAAFSTTTNNQVTKYTNPHLEIEIEE